MAARKRIPEKPKRAPKAEPYMLGTGMARKAGEALKGRAQQLAKQECIAVGGRWVNGQCIYR